MPKPRKLKSGSWNVQIFDYKDPSGKAHFTSITAPTKAEAVYQAARYQKTHPKRDSTIEMTVGAAVDRYIELCQILSPTSTTAYKKMRQTAFQSLMDTPVKRLSPEIVQKAINLESMRPAVKTGRQISAKTVHNEWGLISAALKKICNTTFDVSLPRIRKDRKQYPEPQVVLKAIMDCDQKLPCLLSMWCTFSMSELLGLKCSSVRSGCIYIDQVRVYTEDGWVEKKIAKNAMRNRVQNLPPYLMELIEENPAYKHFKSTGEDGYLFPGSRSKIYNAWTRTALKHGIDLSFHDLRHMSASVMLQLGIPDRYAQERGGWSTSSVMKTVYQHTFSQQRLAADKTVDEYFEQAIKGMNGGMNGTP